MTERQDRQPLLGEPSIREQNAALSEQSAEEDYEGNFEVSVQRVITWTLRLLLGGVILGTVVAVVLVSLPMQRGLDPPGVRKSAAMVVLHPVQHGLWQSAATSEDVGHKRFSRGSLPLQGLEGSSSSPTKLLVWSGKGHRKNFVYDDMHLFDLATQRWTTVFNVSAEKGDEFRLPTPRWKAVSLYELKGNDLVVFGGDPLGADGLDHSYLNDLWRLKAADDNSQLAWQRVTIANQKGGRPEPRRAHAGIVLDVAGNSTLVIHGGRNSSGALLADVWRISLESEGAAWHCSFDRQANDTTASETEDNQHRHKKKKKKKKGTHPAPLPRKGHVAVSIPDTKTPRMVIWGGRNETHYFSDMWAFDLLAEKWEQWAQNSSKAPSARDHLGGFYLNGTIYIYGGRGGKDHDDSVPEGDIWSFDVEVQAWSKIDVPGSLPVPRFLYSMDTYTQVVNDTSDTKMVIFGGESWAGCYLDDVWEYSVLSNSWEQKSAGTLDKRKRKKCAKVV